MSGRYAAENIILHAISKIQPVGNQRTMHLRIFFNLEFGGF